MSGMVCCFTGHRDIKADDLRRIKPRLIGSIESLYREGYTVFISGAAIGFDTYAAAVTASMRAACPGLKLWLAVPFRGHDGCWNEPDRSRFLAISQLCDKEIVLSERYYRGCYQMRDRWMAEHSTACIACYSGGGGGTAYTIAYALKLGLRVINIWDD